MDWSHSIRQGEEIKFSALIITNTLTYVTSLIQCYKCPKWTWSSLSCLPIESNYNWVQMLPHASLDKMLTVAHTTTEWGCGSVFIQPARSGSNQCKLVQTADPLCSVKSKATTPITETTIKRQAHADVIIRWHHHDNNNWHELNTWNKTETDDCEPQMKQHGNPRPNKEQTDKPKQQPKTDQEDQVKLTLFFENSFIYKNTILPFHF